MELNEHNFFAAVIKEHFGQIRKSQDLPALKVAVHRLEFALIDRAMDIAGDNVAEAARLLGLNRTTLAMKLLNRRDKFGLLRGCPEGPVE